MPRGRLIFAIVFEEASLADWPILEGWVCDLAMFLMMFLYVAWFITWTGTFMGTCTMADAKSLGGAMICSCLYYLGGATSLPIYPLGRMGGVMAVPLCIALVWQTIWGAKLLLVVNLNGLSACNLMMGEGYGEARGGWIELLYAPYYLLASVGSLTAILLSHRRYRQERR
jgi:hypothetical protein